MGKVTRKTGIDKDQLHSAEELQIFYELIST